MTRSNGTISRDALMRDVERRSLAAFQFNLSGIRRHRASPDWYRDPQYRSMFVSLSSVAAANPSLRSVSGAELVEHCQRTPYLSSLVVDDFASGNSEQFTASDFDLATEDGYAQSDNTESHCRVLSKDARRRELQDRMAGLSLDTDPDAILSGLRSLLNDDRLFGDDATPQVMSLGELVDSHPELKPELIEGFLRRSEVANIIAATKRGKSWLVYGLSLTVAVGGWLFGRFPCRPGRVLIVDNELHRETLAYRLKTVAEAMRLRPEEYRDRVDVLSLRGRLTSVDGLARLLRGIAKGKYDLIVLDALYRMLEAGVSENDNAAMASLYNALDRLAEETGAAFICIHHTSKGDQSGKSVTDIGSGAGSQSRAADAHIVLRSHEEDDAAVLDAALRSFAPVAPVVLRWEFPLWKADATLDPDRLKVPQNRGDQRQQQRDSEGFDAIVAAMRDRGPLTERKLRQAVGIGKVRLDRLTSIMVADGRLLATETTSGGNPATEFSIAPHIQNW